MIFKSVGLGLCITLVALWCGIISVAIFLAKLGVAVYFTFVNGEFNFMWLDALVYSARGGGGAGVFLGIGIWMMAKLEESKNKSK
ncbi:hypothetical protein HP436_13655 [Pseudomonas sp. CrR14]|nr:hypothetical protein [Pseudomonas sp. CrR14]